MLINQATQVQLRYKLLFPRRGSCVPVYLGQVDSLVHVEYGGGMLSVNAEFKRCTHISAMTLGG